MCHQCGHIPAFHTAEIGCFFEGCSCPQYVELNADGYGTLPLTRTEIEQWCFLTERLLNVTQEIQAKAPGITRRTDVLGY